MRRLALILILAAAAGAIAVAAQMENEAADSAKPADAAKLPANRHDPEDRKAPAVDTSASTGASAARPSAPAPKDTTPARGTDLGKEAEKEDEAFRKGRSEKP